MTDLNYAHVLEQLKRIKTALDQLVNQRVVKDWYTTAEVAERLERAEFTVREWCRLGRIRAEKHACGRGNSQEWMVAHEEVQRIRNQGLLPDPARYRHLG